MKQILTLLFCISLFSCESKKFKYKIIHKNHHKNRDAHFYTDTLEVNGDSVGYHNSNGSYVLISTNFKSDCIVYNLNKLNNE